MGLFDWLNAPLDISGASDGINNLGLIGATLRDVGSSLNGQQSSALDSYYTRAQKANNWAESPPGGDFRASDMNNLGLIGATLRDAGASLNGEPSSALEGFLYPCAKLNAQRRNRRTRDRCVLPAGFSTYGRA